MLRVLIIVIVIVGSISGGLYLDSVQRSAQRIELADCSPISGFVEPCTATLIKRGWPFVTKYDYRDVKSTNKLAATQQADQEKYLRGGRNGGINFAIASLAGFAVLAIFDAIYKRRSNRH